MCHRGSNKLEFSFISQVSCIMYLPLTTRAVVLFVFSLINTVIVNLQWLTFKYALYHRSHLSSFSLHPLSLSLHPAAPKVERLDDNSCEVTWEALQPMKGDPILYALQCMMGNSDFKQVLTLFWVCFFFLPTADLPFITLSFLYSDQDTGGCRAPFNVFTVAVQRSVLVTAGFKLAIMQRSLIHEVSQVSNPCQHIHSSQRPPAMLTRSNGHRRLMLISSHHIWQSNQGVEIFGCHPTWVCFRLYCRTPWPRLESSCLRKRGLFICWGHFYVC